LLEYMALGLGESKEKVRARMIEKMIQPVGKPPEVSFNFRRGEEGLLISML
jgi:hypothetical protein